MRWSVLGQLKIFLLIAAAPLDGAAQINVTTQTPVDIVFDDIADFQNGVFGIGKSITISAILSLIANRNLTVTTASNLTSGVNQIPANVVRLTSVASGWRDHTIFLNPASSQTVTSGINIFLGSQRTYTLRYEVPPTTLLFNRPSGIYSTTLTYHVTGFLSQNATATLNLRIQNVLGISSNFNPVFAVSTADAYINGVSVTRPGALTVTSTLNYDIQVRASGPFSSGSQTIPASHLSIAVLNAGGSVTGNVPLSTTGSQLVNEGSAALQKALDLRYELKGGPHLLNLPTAAYSTTLTYTISAD